MSGFSIVPVWGREEGREEREWIAGVRREAPVLPAGNLTVLRAVCGAIVTHRQTTDPRGHQPTSSVSGVAPTEHRCTANSRGAGSHQDHLTLAAQVAFCLYVCLPVGLSISLPLSLIIPCVQGESMAAVSGHDCSMTPAALLAQVFELADGSDHAPETTNSTLFRKLLRKYFSDEAGRLRSSDMIQRACGELWSRLHEMECRPPDGWASIVVTSLFLLTAKDRGEELVMHMWRIVAHPAEEKYDNGLGRKLMRQAAVAGGTAEHGARTLALMTLVVDTLRRNGCPPEPDSWRSSGSSVARGGTEKKEPLVPSPCGLRLALNVASHTLETFLHVGEGEGRRVPPEVSAEVFEAWRRDVHLEVCLSRGGEDSSL